MLSESEHEELDRLTAQNDGLLLRLAEMGVTIGQDGIQLQRIESKLDTLLGDRIDEAMLSFQQLLAVRWAGLEDQARAMKARAMLGLNGQS